MPVPCSGCCIVCLQTHTPRVRATYLGWPTRRSSAAHHSTIVAQTDCVSASSAQPLFLSSRCQVRRDFVHGVQVCVGVQTEVVARGVASYLVAPAPCPHTLCACCSQELHPAAERAGLDAHVHLHAHARNAEALQRCHCLHCWQVHAAGKRWASHAKAQPACGLVVPALLR